MRTYTYILLPTLALLNWGTTITHAYPSLDLSPSDPAPVVYKHIDPLTPRSGRPRPSPYPVTNGAGADPNPNSPRHTLGSHIATPVPLGSRQVHNADYGTGGPPPNPNSGGDPDADSNDGTSAEPASSASSKRANWSQSEIEFTAGDQRRDSGPLEDDSESPDEGCSEELDECETGGRGRDRDRPRSLIESRSETSIVGGIPMGADDVQTDDSHFPRALKVTEGGWWKRQTTTTDELPLGGPPDAQLGWDRLPEAPGDANDDDSDLVTGWTRRGMNMMIMRNRLRQGNVQERGA